ncbi:MAG: hypothetical protein E7314_03925 [Clostridiales bacterium]|nr:hypothetical protein [Clostridiales bacterium]
MGKVNQRYRRNITEVYKIILMLSDEDKNKIPPKIINFFKENSLEYLLDEIEMTPEKIKNDLSLTTRKFLKMIAIYLK